MIYGVGVDIVHVARLNTWEQFPDQRLEKIFSINELCDCTENGEKNWQKIAVRFAAKEAFYKAFSQTLARLQITHVSMPFIASCKYIQVRTSDWGPTLDINWQGFETSLECQLPLLNVHTSLSHEKESVIAFVVIEKGA